MLEWTNRILHNATPAQRCLIVICLTEPFYLLYMLLHGVALSFAPIRADIRVDVLTGLQSLIGVVVLSFVIAALWLWPRRQSDLPMPRMYVFFACGSTLPYLAETIVLGNFTSPSNLVIIGNVAVGLLLLDTRAVIIAFVMAMVILTLNDALVLAGMMPYAPLFLPGAFEQGMPDIWWSCARNFILFLSIVVYSVLAVVFFNQFDAQRKTLRKLSNTDVLTGLANRRYFMERLEAASGSRQCDGGYCIAIIDADHFKRVNDTYGHPVGDDVLNKIATLLAQGMPTEKEVVARLGGEEFGVLLPQTELPKAVAILERIAEVLRGYFFMAGDQRFQVTLSLGVVECDRHRPEDALRLADANLYQAKAGGRNRIVASRAVQVNRESFCRLA